MSANKAEPQVTGRMPIDELARRARTTTRNIRAHQTRGLLPPPRVVGRTGYYDESHLARLQLITRFQERGFSLAAITEVLRTWGRGGGMDELIGFHEAVTAPFVDEAPQVMTAEQLLALFPEATDRPELLQRSIELGLVEPEDDGFRVPSAHLLQIGRDLVESGVPLEFALEEVGRLKAEAELIAKRFVGLFEEHVMQPYAADGFPPERLPEVTKALQRLRPVGMEAVRILLAQAMEAEVKRAAAEQIEQMGTDQEAS